jgi:hypothetical protein
VSNSSAARVYGICRRSRTVDPPTGNSPQRASATPEARALARDADVGGLEDLGAAGDRDALDRGDQRLLER